ncbi:DUF5317 domain-containing protein [Bacillus marinisedimentorum]|uniref:DUF5317 domain-containing protein n=1 Tax=Bacillus marinisedimentorum TaxID=1821260 RepID=UPI0007DE70A8|nr:DUF5317 domain-containing protein [Bacillus marinisedimentorum]
MVFDGIILSLLIGFFRGGNLKGIADLKLKFGWVFPVLLGVQLIIYFTQNSFEWIANFSSVSFMLVYIVGLYFLWVNRSYEGFGILFIGVFLNFIVMLVNGGRMPVSVEAAAVLDPHYIDALKNGLYAKHTILNNTTNLGFLGDIIALQPPYPRSQVISIGDIIMNIGAFIFLQHLMLKHNHKREIRHV